MEPFLGLKASWPSTEASVSSQAMALSWFLAPFGHREGVGHDRERAVGARAPSVQPKSVSGFQPLGR